MTIFGVHTNAQGKPLADLISVWQHVDQLGFGWISISDHFPGTIQPTSNEAVTTQMAMAASTTRAQCGVLVYSISFRNPAVLATAVTTLDHYSGGRAAIGLGAGSVAGDYETFGFPNWSSLSKRQDMLEEGARCVVGLLHDDVVDFAGEYFQLKGARNQPRPLQDRLPVWIGVKGERRGLRIAAQYADGWNLAFETPQVFSHKREILHRHCADVGRNPVEIRCSVNLILAVDTEDSVPEAARPAALVGSVDQIVDGIGAYVERGVDQVNFFLPYPWDYDGLTKLAAALHLPAV